MRGKERKNPHPRHVVLHHDDFGAFRCRWWTWTESWLKKREVSMSEDASYERERGARSHDRTSADQMRSRAPGSAVQCMLEVVSQSSAQVGFSEREEGQDERAERTAN